MVRISPLTDKILKIVLQLDDGTLIVNERFQKKIRDGYGFSVSKRFANVSVGANIEMFFENPANSGRTVYIIAVECVTQGRAWIDLYRGATITTPGTSLTPVNLNFASTNTSVVSVEYGGTYDVTGAALVHETISPSGKAIGSLAEVGETVIMQENNNLLIRFINNDSASIDMSIRIIWWEET